MGCSASKGSSTRKRMPQESWYAPVSRCASAPIHYVAEVEKDHYHFDGSPSTRHGLIKRGASTRRQAARNGHGTLASLLEEDKLPFIKNHRKGTSEHAYQAGQRDAKVYARESRKCFASVKPCSKLNSVEEVSESNSCDVETINTWELMQGLDEDDDGSRTSSPIKKPLPSRHGVLEKSVSFNKVHGLDSCFAEMGSPVWRRYFSAQEGGRCEMLDSVEMTSFNHEDNKLGANQNPAKSPLRSPLQSPLKSPWRIPALMKSPIRSPFKSPSSPLFDPSLLAKFEQAVEAVALPHDEWLVTQNSTDGSMTTSTSSFNNHTWVSSETSSDGDSAQCIPKESPPMMKSQKASPWIKDVSYGLESFKLRCPPKGEDKVVLYFTSLRGVRKTYEECCNVRLILRGLGVHVDERDVWMHLKFREELTELLDNKKCQVPKLFIKGRYIGGMEDVRQLHEDGYLMGLIEGLPCFGLFRKACEGCADVRFVPCFTCRGSCKVLNEADHVVRCSECNENGLIMCPLCS